MKVEKLGRAELNEYLQSLGFEIKKKTKGQLLEEYYQYQRSAIEQAKEEGRCFELLTEKINELADEYASNLDNKISERKEEMENDDFSHYLIYRVLGISNEEGKLIDVYQNTGRFLYKYAGSFLEEAASMCFYFNNLDGSKTLVENTEGTRPKTFEIDFLNGNDAVEIKWRDATTDGDHITKEHTRVKAIKGHGYNPIRVMFYYPQREQAKRIQEALKTIYAGVGGEYYSDEDAWTYVRNVTGYDLKQILSEIAERRDNE